MRYHAVGIQGLQGPRTVIFQSNGRVFLSVHLRNLKKRQYFMVLALFWHCFSTVGTVLTLFSTVLTSGTPVLTSGTPVLTSGIWVLGWLYGSLDGYMGPGMAIWVPGWLYGPGISHGLGPGNTNVSQLGTTPVPTMYYPGYTLPLPTRAHCDLSG